MSCQNFEEIEKNLELGKKIRKLGICSTIVGPTGPKGDKGDIGPAGGVIPSVTEGLLFVGFADTKEDLEIQDSWIIPNQSPYFQILENNEIEISPGIYEITLSGLIEDADDTHGATIYLKDDTGAAIKDLTFSLPAGNLKQMYFSQDILFRFEDITKIKVETNILGDEKSSNITISNTNLVLKKIHE